MRWLLVLLLICAPPLRSQESGGQEAGRGGNYEFIDLGKLQVEGEFATPTDILIQEQAKKKLRQKLYDRKNFRRENFMDIYNLK